MGEIMEQCIEFVFILRELEVQFIFINLLQFIFGILLEKMDCFVEVEILIIIVLFCFINFIVFFCFVGGCLQMSVEVVKKVLYIGINFVIVGDLLIILGFKVLEDKILIEEVGYLF